jgi:hypothetical protein
VSTAKEKQQEALVSTTIATAGLAAQTMIAAKRKDVSAMTLKEAAEDFGSAGRQNAEQVTVQDDEEAQESLNYYDVLIELLVYVKDAPLTAESAREILERHGLDGLMVLVSDDQPEIQDEAAAIDNLLDDLIDHDALSRELST